VNPTSTLADPTLVPLGPHSGPAPAVSDAVRDQISDLSQSIDAIRERLTELAAAAGDGKHVLTRLDVFHGYMWIFVVAFITSLFATPIMRRVAIHFGVVDRPSEARKIHRTPTAYLGGVAVYLGVFAAITFTYAAPFHGLIEFHPSANPARGLPGGVPVSILLGMTVIMLCGLIDDVMGIDPRAKIAGQLFAAAALALEDVGVRVAAGLLVPLAKGVGIATVNIKGFETIAFNIPLSWAGLPDVPIDVVYWVGTAVIAVFVIGACNASNLIDGLDGLLSGVTSIAAGGLLLIALALAVVDDGGRGIGPNLDAPRIILCMGLLGACLGFLPHNFNPATIFLGDAGSLLLGYLTITIVLTLGSTGQTQLVVAGLIIYAIPIIDTTLAIARRKIAGRKISDADDQHLHHMLKRALGVKGAVFALYGIGVAFAIMGVLLSEERGRVIYSLILVFAAFVGVTSFKIARRGEIERQMRDAEERRKQAAPPAPVSAPFPAPAPVSGPSATVPASTPAPAAANPAVPAKPA
jgi:UDP-GlcNAc:undecaprenyl-phosphate GlcNAc-1-phosphate transferase